MSAGRLLLNIVECDTVGTYYYCVNDTLLLRKEGNRSLLAPPAFLWGQFIGMLGFETFGTCTDLAGLDLSYSYSYGMYECTDNEAIMSYYDSENCTGDAAESIEVSNSTCSNFNTTSRCITEGEGTKRRRYR